MFKEGEYFMKKRIKLCFSAILVFLIIGIIYAIAMIFFIRSAMTEIAPDGIEVMVILGAQVKGTPAYPSLTLKERLDFALDYFERNEHVTIIVCGGQGADESDTEANVMANYLIARGVPDTQIIKEDTSTRTAENIANALKKTTINQMVIVTSDFHMYRAKMLARRLGVNEVYGHSAETENLSKYKSYFREVIALGYGLIFDR